MIRNRGRPARWAGLARLAIRRYATSLTRRFPNRTAAATVIVALSVAMLVVVTGISLGLAAQGTVQSEAVDYWIVPESASTLNTLVSVGGAQLGDVHAKSASIRAEPGVRSATPVLIEVVRLHAEHNDRPRYVVAIGVVPDDNGSTIAGLSTAPLTPGDPHFENGTYNGPFTGEVVLSPAAASQLNATETDALVVQSPTTGQLSQRFTVTAVSESGLRSVQGEFPVAVVHLSELQTLTGAAGPDHADQILVASNDPAVRDSIEANYPGSLVITRTGLTTQQVMNAELPLAMAGAALFVALVVSALLVATTVGLEVEANRRELAILDAVGVSGRARLGIVLLTTLCITMTGGVVGVGLGAIGVGVVNHIAVTQAGTLPFAVLRPALGGYALGVALVMGLLAAPYPLWLARRTDTARELAR